MNKPEKYTSVPEISILTTLCIVFLSVSPLFASEAKNIRFEASYMDSGASMSLQGVGSKSVILIKAFEAGFYLSDEASPENPLADVPKHLEVSYFVPISARDLNDYTVKRMKLNVTDEEFQKIRDKVALMEEYFVDLKPGDRFALTYIPGTGTKFLYNGQLVGIIEGADFAKGLFSVWVGARPFDYRLKSQILGLNNKARESGSL